MAKRNQPVPHCNVCDRSPLITEGGVEVFEVRLTVADDTLVGDLCDDDLSGLREAAATAKLAPSTPHRRRRSFEDSIVSGPEAIPKETEDGK